MLYHCCCVFHGAVASSAIKLHYSTAGENMIQLVCMECHVIPIIQCKYKFLHVIHKTSEFYKNSNDRALENEQHTSEHK